MEGWEVTPGPRVRGYAIGEFLCPECGGVANIIVAKVRADRGCPYGQGVVTWWVPWRAYVTVELICQGPGDVDAPDEGHAGEVIDLLGTGYQPIGLN